MAIHLLLALAALLDAATQMARFSATPEELAKVWVRTDFESVLAPYRRRA